MAKAERRDGGEISANGSGSSNGVAAGDLKIISTYGDGNISIGEIAAHGAKVMTSMKIKRK